MLLLHLEANMLESKLIQFQREEEFLNGLTLAQLQELNYLMRMGLDPKRVLLAIMNKEDAQTVA